MVRGRDVMLFVPGPKFVNTTKERVQQIDNAISRGRGEISAKFDDAAYILRGRFAALREALRGKGELYRQDETERLNTLVRGRSELAFVVSVFRVWRTPGATASPEP